MSYLRSLNEWRALASHAAEFGAKVDLNLLYQQQVDSRRERFSQRLGPISVDYSRNYVTEQTMNLFFKFARALKIDKKIDALFSSEHVNFTEDKPVLHMALRQLDENEGNYPEAIVNAISNSRIKEQTFVDQIRSRYFLGQSGKPVKHIVHIGIGGSELGPKMVTKALKIFQIEALDFHFISNCCPFGLSELLENIQLDESLFIFCSKSFETTEVMEHLSKFIKLFGIERFKKQSVAVTENVSKARQLGFNPKNILPMWPWLVGRYSLWSSIGLTIQIAIGTKRFNELMSGAALVDRHVKHADLDSNLPLRLALLDNWYVNFFNGFSRAIVPYASPLKTFVPFVQQLMMESNGKSIDEDGEQVDYATSPIIWGGGRQ